MGYNLIYNGDFSKGTDSWSGTNITVSNGVLSLKGNLSQNIKYLVPVSSNRRYRLTYDLKVTNKVGTSNFYIALIPYDNTKTAINMGYVNKPLGSNKCNTTLASAVANGDTTITLTSTADYPTNRSLQKVGICNKLAWGYNRCTYAQLYSSINGNIITLKTAWNGGSFAAGTKVSEFEDGNTYFYPHYLSNANIPSEWTTYSVEFIGGNNMRYSCQYFLFSTLGYSHEYSMRNIKIECISDTQYPRYVNNVNNILLNEQGIWTGYNFREDIIKARYVRDTISGNTANSNNHWCEFQVFNDVNENIAWGRDVKINTTNYANSIVTDGIISGDWIPSGVGGTASLIFDIGYIENISKIKIWHYYPDGRTYNNNITEISVDGTNWKTVYKGQKPETINGNEIIVTPDALIEENGNYLANNFYEI